eukprot:UN12893
MTNNQMKSTLVICDKLERKQLFLEITIYSTTHL